MYFVQLEFFAIIMVNAKEFLIFRVSLDNQTEPNNSLEIPLSYKNEFLVHDESFIVIPFSTECNVTIYNEAEWICMDDTGPHWLADNVSCTRILTPD